jgi:hypothetical protein
MAGRPLADRYAQNLADSCPALPLELVLQEDGAGGDVGGVVGRVVVGLAVDGFLVVAVVARGLAAVVVEVDASTVVDVELELDVVLEDAELDDVEDDPVATRSPSPSSFPMARPAVSAPTATTAAATARSTRPRAVNPPNQDSMGVQPR